LCPKAILACEVDSMLLKELVGYGWRLKECESAIVVVEAHVSNRTCLQAFVGLMRTA